MRIIRYIINYIGELEVADPFQGGEKDGYVVVCRCSFNFQSLQGLYFLSTILMRIFNKRIPTAISYYCSHMKISPNTVIPETS